VVRNCDTYSKASHVVACVSTLIHWGSSEGWIPTKTERLLKDLKTIKKAKKARKSGESRLYVDKKLIPTHGMVAEVASEAARVSGIWWYELMFNLAAYSGLRLGEIIDLDIDRINLKEQEITVETQCLDVGGVQSRTAPKWNVERKTTFPKVTPMGYPLQKKLRQRINELKKLEEVPEVQDGSYRLLLFPNKSGGWLSPSKFSSKVRRPAQDAANWPKDNSGKFIWNFHSLRHVFATYYFAELGKDIRDVSIVAGHKSYTTTLEMYVGNVDGAIERLKV
jgi:integrase